MSVDLSKLAVREQLDISSLNGKVVAVDAYNVLYQFLSIIRQPDGSLLCDEKGNVTSHLSGLFYRSIDLIAKGIKLVYVFDGMPSTLKKKTIEARISRREKAYEEWQKAVAAGQAEEVRKFAQASTRITKEIVSSAKELLGHMGIYYINAPSEGEAQASYMCSKGIAYAAASQDYDTLLFGSKKVVRNLTLSGRRKLPGKNVFVNVNPEMVDLDATLESLGITRQKLIWVGILLGTDFNDGVKGVGPKTALKAVKSSNSISDVIEFAKQKFGYEFEVDPKDVEDLFMNPEVSEITEAEVSKGVSKRPDIEKIINFMCAEHGFDEARVRKFSEILKKASGASAQKGISSWM